MKKSILVLGTLFLLAGCAQKIIHFTNDSAQFASYQSFAVVNYKTTDRDISAEGTRVMTNIQKEISNQMLRREYKSNASNPDVLVRFELISNQVSETSSQNYPYSMRSFYFPDQYFRTRTYLQSALLIEITDRKTNKLVWQASTDLDKYRKKKNDQEILKSAINEMFNTYLYKAGSKSPDETLLVER